MPPRLTIIHLARKPLIGTVATTALKYGTGGLNIDGTRIGGPAWVWGTQTDIRGGGYGTKRPSEGHIMAHNVQSHPKGRWPSNVILQHEPGCTLVGTHHEEFLIQNYTDPTAGNFSFFAESNADRPGLTAKKAGQEVEDWTCTEGCPVRDLNEQSGEVRSAGHHPVSPDWEGTNHIYGQGIGNTVQGPLYADGGGASRFFKQVKHTHDLIEYLRTMISPPAPSPVAVAMEGWPDWVETAPKGSCTGLIIYGLKPTATQVQTLSDLLTPGGHVCLFAPDDQPTGHTGAILLEDTGFEIRDALLWVRGPGRIHYVAKAARKEREAGCQHLPAKKGFEAVERQEGSAGVQNPRAGAGRTADKVHNSHPTVKPIELMVRLLADVPKDCGPVLDPFMGSGTTMVACRKTGHDGTGIEREEEYLRISEARVRYWDSIVPGESGAEILSDLERVVESPKESNLTDWFD